MSTKKKLLKFLFKNGYIWFKYRTEPGTITEKWYRWYHHRKIVVAIVDVHLLWNVMAKMVSFDNCTQYYFGRHYKNSYGWVTSNCTVVLYKRMQRGACFVLRSLGATCFTNQFSIFQPPTIHSVRPPNPAQTTVVKCSWEYADLQRAYHNNSPCKTRGANKVDHGQLENSE